MFVVVRYNKGNRTLSISFVVVSCKTENKTLSILFAVIDGKKDNRTLKRLGYDNESCGERRRCAGGMI